MSRLSWTCRWLVRLNRTREVDQPEPPVMPWLPSHESVPRDYAGGSMAMRVPSVTSSASNDAVALRSDTSLRSPRW